MDLVSVIAPVYNNHRTLKETLDSIVQQDYRPLEIVIVDDASDDESFAFAKAYSLQYQQHDTKFILHQNLKNSGAGVTRNKALGLATGRYMAFLDADDIWKPEKLTKQINALKLSGKSVCYSAYEIFEEDYLKPIAIHNVFPELTFEKLHKTNYLGNLTGIYDASLIGKVKISSIRKRQDWAMWLDVLKIAGPAVGIQEPLASYRLGAGLSASKLDLIKYNYSVYRTHLGYSIFKSCWYMTLFFYEQFFIKNAMRKTI
ncbi:glycosyltransferase family 2 protein [Nonlabens marinus]|uniref:Putative N-acetylgalactosaminyl-diphosphoundecaprenol glucuronosyltransferase n=1 Tax=Nonlabens marinus S1-08 TaxID=1454201 RepID=W8VQ56_9FLAO|nr:glycosyltransferase family 2 protein [Nonlabens marinus]BAO54865.1 putative N-acetylgalactosaminyl-diphosphoundecaprenol glucuronosyltransferase [Nonlabens marinus S1-08]